MESKQILLDGDSSWKLQPCKLQASNYSASDLSAGESSSQRNDLGKAPMEVDASCDLEDYGVDEEDYDDYLYDDDVSEGYNDDDYGLAAFSDYDKFVAAKFDNLDLPPGVEATVPWLSATKCEPEIPPSTRPRNEADHAIQKKFKEFKQFDTVPDFPDHHFLKHSSAGTKPSKEWVKKVQQDWKLLEKDLPDTIMVRACENKMDLLRAAIVGPNGTPYHNGLFFFDIQFSSDYPHSPPKVHYHSGGLRINPNLYECGKVCLSLLNTWSGSGCEKWSKNSTMLQVLVSIQALVLNEKPYFNEPGYSRSINTPAGERASLLYNETRFLYSCKTMLYSLRNPAKHFEDYVAGHFREYGCTILKACKAYSEGVMIGSKIPDEDEETEEIKEDKTKPEGDCSFVTSVQFKSGLASLFEELLMEFTVKGANTDKFLAEKRKEKHLGCSTSSLSK